ncbi:hypothetical protein IAG41_11965 [Sphingomonas sp. JC676]|uniref:hypothetical protein n=1 Tax=Sphingomonas sp. JC676 TaxID=2768065 RepID=UPI001657A3B9|nr:hypothetical protein [Sphingomonas sp. JC676]MBC9033106.1 hypothetical protein [Sphingomonas sp. JC676]
MRITILLVLAAGATLAGGRSAQAQTRTATASAPASSEYRHTEFGDDLSRHQVLAGVDYRF